MHLERTLPGDAQPTSDFKGEMNLCGVEPWEFQHLLVFAA